MKVSPDNLLWPALLVNNNSDELLYLADAGDYRRELLMTPTFQPGDKLVDSNGVVYALHDTDKPSVGSGLQEMSVEELLQLVKRHASVCGYCCVSKISTESIAEAVALVGQLE